MPRPRIPAGETGKIQITRLDDGRYRARARARDTSGDLQQVRVTAETEAEARAKLMRRFRPHGVTVQADLTPTNTIEEACNAWVESVRLRAQAGAISYSALKSYEQTLRLAIVPRCGPVTLSTLTAGRCDRLNQSILRDQSLCSARRAKTVLSLVCAYAVRDDAMATNPVREVPKLPRSKKKTAILTPKQMSTIRELMEGWGKDNRSGSRPNYRALLDGMDIMLGTSARVGECLALRRCDVEMTTAPPTLLINGTITQDREYGTHRKNSPKQSRQVRRIALPPSAASAIRRRLARAVSGPDAYLFPTRKGGPMSMSAFQRLHRSFVEDNQKSLVEVGVNLGESSTHIYRRTVATLVERTGGITLAARLLGHANEQVTRANYVVTAELVNPRTAEIIETTFDG